MIETISTLGRLILHGGILISLLSPSMLYMTSMSLFTDIPIARALLSLSERVKVALHRIGDLVYVPHLLVLFETVKLLSGIGWWQIRRQELYGRCWTTSFKRVY